MSSTSLSTWLSENKAKFLEAVKADGAKEWTVVMGNEAGDLDSIASAIGYSYLTPRKPTIGLIQTPRTDLYLRNENLYAFSLAHLSSNNDDLFTIDDLPVPPSELKSTFALVDHNSLLPVWERPDSENPSTVVGIIDHHEDDGKHKNADPRVIVTPIGSCATLVTETFNESWAAADPALSPPVDLATLLLTAIYIDTSGLKKGGKGEPRDIEAATFLESYGQAAALGGESADEFRSTTTKELSHKKGSVEHLSSRDLLRRDYKQYQFTTVDGVTIAVGLSTVPFGTKPWLAKDPTGYRAALEAWAVERKLDVVGVLNTFKTEKKKEKRREVIVLVGGAATSADAANVTALANALEKGLEASKELKLESVKIKGDYADVLGAPGEHDHDKEVPGVIKVWKQNNVDASRKVIGPIFKAVIESAKGFRANVTVKPE